MIVFVSGGARSGKSLVAEQCVQQYADGKTCYYVATADIYDSEMAERVGHHQARRANHWVTLEAPLNIEQAVAQVPNGHAALLDCLTLWASQVMFNTQEDAAPVSETEAFALLVRALHDARRRGVTLVVVSNDLNEAPLPASAEVWRYVEFLQKLHRWLAAQADRVVEVVAGQTIEWKAAGAP